MKVAPKIEVLLPLRTIHFLRETSQASVIIAPKGSL